MRGIMILGDRYYITDTPITYDEDAGCYTADLATGGTVHVPKQQLVAFESYETDEVAVFRARLRVLEATLKETP